MTPLRVLYVWDEILINECNRLPAVFGRARMVHNLIATYGLLDKVTLVKSSPSTYKDLKKFHTAIYIDHLKQFTYVDDDYVSNEKDEEFGIGYDCPPVSNMFDLISTIAGGSLTAIKCLMLGIADVAINWCGGWHHAKKSHASGFCYVNDIVVSIELLRIKFPKILYIDLDVHHGDAVQDAYYTSNSVFTLSLHKYEAGFYPGTGSIDEIGDGVGKGYSCNVPLHEGCSDTTFEYAFKKVFSIVYEHFNPDAIIVQCGADALANDPNGTSNLTAYSYSTCVREILDKRKPTVLLGGGGYNHPNTARLWTTLTALVVDVDLDENIPEHNNWPQYGPGFMLPIEPTLAKDVNKIEYLDGCIAKINDNLEKYLGNNGHSEITVKKQKTEEQVLPTVNMPKYSKISRKFKNPLDDNAQQTRSNEASTDVYEFVD